MNTDAFGGVGAAGEEPARSRDRSLPLRTRLETDFSLTPASATSRGDWR